MPLLLPIIQTLGHNPDTVVEGGRTLHSILP
jgi:hypothetical protein